MWDPHVSLFFYFFLSSLLSLFFFSSPLRQWQRQRGRGKGGEGRQPTMGDHSRRPPAPLPVPHRLAVLVVAPLPFPNSRWLPSLSPFFSSRREAAVAEPLEAAELGRDCRPRLPSLLPLACPSLSLPLLKRREEEKRRDERRNKWLIYGSNIFLFFYFAD